MYDIAMLHSLFYPPLILKVAVFIAVVHTDIRVLYLVDHPIMQFSFTLFLRHNLLHGLEILRDFGAMAIDSVHQLNDGMNGAEISFTFIVSTTAAISVGRLRIWNREVIFPVWLSL